MIINLKEEFEKFLGYNELVNDFLKEKYGQFQDPIKINNQISRIVRSKVDTQYNSEAGEIYHSRTIEYLLSNHNQMEELENLLAIPNSIKEEEFKKELTNYIKESINS